MDERSTELPDGEYSIFVIDADHLDDGAVRLEITITTGDHKGEIVAVRGAHLLRDPLELMGMPGTLFVIDGVPRVAIEE